MNTKQKNIVEQIVRNLNLLAENEIFEIVSRNIWDMANRWEVEIRCKNTAYRRELFELLELLDNMHPLSNDAPTQVVIH